MFARPRHKKLEVRVTLRYDDQRRILRCSVRDLVEVSRLRGHLNMELVQTPMARLALGRMIHDQYQTYQEGVNAQYQRESTLKVQLDIMGWQIQLVGRVDGVLQEGAYTVVEEIKSTAMDAYRLRSTDLGDWPQYAAQVETYLWMMNELGRSSVTGRLVLISVLDGTRHSLGVDLGFGSVDVRIRAQLQALIARREERIRWMGNRRSRGQSLPFERWRPGQEEILDAVSTSLEQQQPLLVEAPTGLGKTAPILAGALRHVCARDQQVFWATSKTTQQEVVQRTTRLMDTVRSVTLVAKEKACLNDVVACHPEHCRFAADYYTKVTEANLHKSAWDQPILDREALRELGQSHEVCPYQLALDLTATADVVIGDYNYAFDPERSVLFAKEPRDWAVIVDEAHQLTERGRAYGSPSISATKALNAATFLAEIEPHRFGPFIQLAKDITDAILDAANDIEVPLRDGLALVDPSRQLWSEIADRIDEVALDYARVRAAVPTVAPGETDPWLDLARATLRFCRVMDSMEDETVVLVNLSPGAQRLQLLCLDPSRLLNERTASFGGWVGCSATMHPVNYYLDLFGLDVDTTNTLHIPAYFPPERRKVIVASRISTLFKDRHVHAAATAQLIQQCISVTPGNVAVYFPSFAMLDNITSQMDECTGQMFIQTPNMSESQRAEWLGALKTEGSKKVLAAVLGGIFSEGIDLPPRTLSAVLVVGPALPPVGLERDLLKSCYQERYGAGFQYASLIPGMTKVIQAAGRLLRSAEDKGTIVLIGRRFLWRDYLALLPEWWDIEHPEDPVDAIQSFWNTHLDE